MNRETESSATSSNHDTVLIADDEALQLMIIEGMLKQHGFNVIAVNSGKEAIKIYKKFKPSLILLDGMMPGIDGFETCREIRKLDSNDETSIIMLTGLDDDDSIRKAFEAGAIDYIRKPVYWPVLLARLNYLINEKTTEKRVRHTQKMEALGNIANVMTHNFNNILASLLGNMQLLESELKTTGSEKSKKHLREIGIAANKALNLVSQMRVLTEIKISNPVELFPDDLLKGTFSIIEPTLPDSIKISLKIDSDISAIKADPSQFQNIIINLISNSREAITDHGTIDISLRNTAVTKAYCNSCLKDFHGDFVELEFTDNGCGISDEYLTRIFDPYYSTKPIYIATGMGLATVHSIVHESGGHILVDNKRERGVSFRIFFPRFENSPD